MTEEESLRSTIDEQVALHAYEPAWCSAFASERTRLDALAPGVFLEIEHVGSTAVPGMRAKPIIDLLAGVESMARAKAVGEVVCALGYTTSDAFNRTLVDRQWFMRWADGRRTHHLHVVVQGGDAWCGHLAFRDALRSDASLASRYVALKSQLAARHSGDREAYTDGKSAFIRSVLRDGGTRSVGY
jgi:GrpB-like predicted nucleotidyltransferase (UPF0157 family)